jgi:hypothetical protein
MPLHFREFSEPKFAMTSLTDHCKFEMAENSLQLSNSGKKCQVHPEVGDTQPEP